MFQGLGEKWGCPGPGGKGRGQEGPEKAQEPQSAMARVQLWSQWEEGQ